MDASSLDFLKTLLNTPGPSGYERRSNRLFAITPSRSLMKSTTDVMATSRLAVNPARRCE